MFVEQSSRAISYLKHRVLSTDNHTELNLGMVILVNSDHEFHCVKLFVKHFHSTYVTCNLNVTAEESWEMKIQERKKHVRNTDCAHQDT